MEPVLWALKTDKVKAALKEEKRLDDRALDAYRDIEVSNEVSKNAEGSARVRLGKTDVIAGVKMILGTPYPDSPGEGTISVGAELHPMAFSEYEFGPPKPDAIEVSRVVDRCIRESKTLNFKDLCIKEGEQIWICFIDLYPLNDDGNLFDAFSIAGLAALIDTKIPKIEDDKIVKGEYSGKLKLARQPLLSTFAKIGNTVVLDPTMVEQKAQDARFSVATTDDNYLCAFQKGGFGGFTGAEIDSCIDIATKASKMVRKKL